MWGVVAASWRRAYARSARTFQPGQPTRGAIVDPRNGMNVETFLKTIGRECEKYTDKFATWESLIGSTNENLRELGMKPQQRKWLLNWLDKYRNNVEPFYLRPRPPKVRESVKKGRR